MRLCSPAQTPGSPVPLTTGSKTPDDPSADGCRDRGDEQLTHIVRVRQSFFYYFTSSLTFILSQNFGV
jgi:hypothetical protein